MSNNSLFALSLNPGGKQTILLLHGIFSSHLEYANVVPFLSDHHLLAVDLPRHSRSAHVRPFQLPAAAEHVAEVIRTQAQNCRAHVVGLSGGGFVALELSKRHPDLVESLFVTGASPFTGWTKWLAEHPGILYYCIASFVKYCPDWLYRKMCSWGGLLPHDDLRMEMKKNLNKDLLAEGYGSMVKFTKADICLITARTLTMAGGLQDDVEATREMGKVLRGKCPESKAAVVKGAVHAWNLQFPELFATAVRTWIGGFDSPEGLEELL
ncbi:uncharacterized protein Z518_11219 [Rhinocladiella mackenziei CBS 650.93]|uniref:AB hydrolase-1 domain-containing protein n=1 Tax=Rhinocladiella mackenziei CBS 650.93 TaxID=1442369 RepID=A0A0D2I8C4_9EURO|nr:uncharacterized protein Z518_11219 [Rhinocladiella mackenziei CBS 650.93]KIW99480.1 hypothetical protein Z518_11219 [Rhinocladiella mackenziei CBS 650.93]